MPHNIDKEFCSISSLIEHVFKSFIYTGLHICDFTTGSGKSYTLGKLTCNYYTKHFDKIIILCVQNKLVDTMYQDLVQFTKEGSLISEKDILFIHNNYELLKNAKSNNYLKQFSLELDKLIKQLNNAKYTFYITKEESKELLIEYNILKTQLNLVNDIFDSDNINIINNNQDIINKKIEKEHVKLRSLIRKFFDVYSKLISDKYQYYLTYDYFRDLCPTLFKIYPQIDFRNKKVIIMTIHKAMYGIDPIFYDNISITNLIAKGQKTLIFFDESDQCAIAMRQIIIDKACSIQNKYDIDSYHGFLNFESLFDGEVNRFSKYYFNNSLIDTLKDIRQEQQKVWQNTLQFPDHDKIPMFINIHLNCAEDYNKYRNAIFFSGSLNHIEFNLTNNASHSFICCNNKDSSKFTLVYASDIKEIQDSFNYILPLDKFANLSERLGKIYLTKFSNLIDKIFNINKSRFKKAIAQFTNDINNINYYCSYPNLEKEIHTLVARFPTKNDYILDQILQDYILYYKSNLSLTHDIQDYSIYSHGFKLYQEKLDENDIEHNVKITKHAIKILPERILLHMLKENNASIVLCSATANTRSVICNFDIKYLKNMLGSRFYTIAKDYIVNFGKLLQKSYPVGHKIKIYSLEHYKYDDERIDKWRLPDKYRSLFCSQALADNLVNNWFSCTIKYLKNKYDVDGDNDKCKKINFELYRIFQFIEAYNFFITHQDIHSMLYFQNFTLKDYNLRQFNVIACLIDGSYVQQKSKLNIELPKDWHNANLRNTNKWEDVLEILKELTNNKDAKIMLISAYASFKAGANMQYEIPTSLKYLKGTNFKDKNLQKDWDAIFLQCPRSYLFYQKDCLDDEKAQKDFYKIILDLAMLFEQQIFSSKEISNLLKQILQGKLFFKEDDYPAVHIDKVAWMTCILEQAVGRICRTKNKNPTTYILYDADINKYINNSVLDKPLTVEFRALIEHILHKKYDNKYYIKAANNLITNKSAIAINIFNANLRKALAHIDYILHATTKDNSVLTKVNRTQQQNLSLLKNIFIRYPSVNDMSELYRLYNSNLIELYYSNWSINDRQEISFFMDTESKACLPSDPHDSKFKHYVVSPTSVRLDIFCKNKYILKHFKEHGIATSWSNHSMILHPYFLMYAYAGEIGEEAFKAILLSQTICTVDNIKHPDNDEYELVDLIVYGPNNKRIGFDIKNINPNKLHEDNLNDIPSTVKRKKKKEYLNCQIITVNLLEITTPSIAVADEIHGLIDLNGNFIHAHIEQLKSIIEVIING